MVAIADESGPWGGAYPYDGIYRPDQISRYLLIPLPEHLRRHQPPSPSRIRRWAYEGLIAPGQQGQTGQWYVLNFADLVSCQAIALMREAGLSYNAIRAAETFFSEDGKRQHPFAYRDIWYSRREIVSRLGEDQVVSGVRPGQLGWNFILDGMYSLREQLGWSPETGKAEWWEPRPHILLHPEIQFGKPCVKGTRITTSTIWSYVTAGETPASVADDYDLPVIAVQRAYDWEKQVRADVATSTYVPA